MSAGNEQGGPPDGQGLKAEIVDAEVVDSEVVDAEVVTAEVVEPVAKRLAADSGGRVFDADGRLDRHSGGGSNAHAHVSVQGDVRGGCSGPIFRWVGRLFGLFAVLMLTASFLWAGGFTLSGAVDWAHNNPVFARVGIVAFVTVMMPFMLPTGPVAIVPGYIWGQAEGLGLILIGACLGGLLNMALARRVFGPRFNAFVSATPGFSGLRQVIDARGFRIALALRLSPVTPYALVSYLAGLTGIRFSTYAAASVIGGVPWTLVYATAGALLASQGKAVTLDAELGPAGPWLRIGGLALTLVVAVWIGRLARKELASARREMG